MAKNHEWTQPKSDVTLEKVIEVTEIIVNKIQGNNGKWTGTIADIMSIANESDPEEYGTYLQAVETATKLYKLQWNKAGRNGREYYIESADLARFYAQKAQLSKAFEYSVDFTITCPHCVKPTNYTITVKENK
jgi:hypothetical protein